MADTSPLPAFELTATQVAKLTSGSMRATHTVIVDLLKQAPELSLPPNLLAPRFLSFHNEHLTGAAWSALLQEPVRTVEDLQASRRKAFAILQPALAAHLRVIADVPELQNIRASTADELAALGRECLPSGHYAQQYALMCIWAAADQLNMFTSRQNCRYGQHGESAILRAYSDTHEMKALHNAGNEQRALQLPNYTVNFVGRVDGLLQDGTILEVKHRTTPISRHIRQSDFTQVLVYMYIRHATSAILLEAVNGRIAETRSVCWSDGEWTAVGCRVASALQFVSLLCECPIRLRAYLGLAALPASTQHLQLLRSHFGSEI